MARELRESAAVKDRDVRKLRDGLYTLQFKTGAPEELAVVGHFWDGNPGRWFVLASRKETKRNRAELVQTDWENVESVTLIRDNATQAAIQIAQVVAPSDIDPNVAAIIRDAFLAGNDKEAIAILRVAIGDKPKLAATFDPSEAIIDSVKQLRLITDFGRYVHERDRKDCK